MNKAKLELNVDPLGDMYVQWEIPISFIKNEVLELDLPTFKYEMSNFLGVPVPIASIAESLQCEIFEVLISNQETYKILFDVILNWKGRRTLFIELKDINKESDEILVIRYVIKNLVTKDKVFFNFVFTISSPIPNQIIADITVLVHFAYHISHHRLKTAAINKMTGRIVTDTGLITHKRTGDFIKGKGSSVLIENDGLLDLHVHGSRIPFPIDRRYFWIVIYLISLIGFGGLISLYAFLIKMLLNLF